MTSKETTSLEKASVVLFSMMMLANVINYAYQIVMGNVLSIEEYGSLNALLALSTIASVPSGAFLMAASRVTAQCIAANSTKSLDLQLNTIFVGSVLLGSLFLVTGCILSAPIAKALGIDSIPSVVITILFVGLNCIYPVLSGVLQGASRFVEYGLSSIVSMLSKLIVSLLFIACGLGLAGALAGLALSPICAGVFCYLRITDLFKLSTPNVVSKKTVDLLRSFGGLLIAQALLAAVTNGDALLIKIMFDPEAAGIYSSGMVLAKIPMYAASAIVAALFPLAASVSAHRKESFALFKKSILYGGIISFAFALLLNIFGKQLMQLLFNSCYLPAVEHLPVVTFLSISITLITILLNYVAAIGDLKIFNVVCTLSCLVGYACAAGFGESINSSVLILSVSYFFMFAACLIVLSKRHSANNNFTMKVRSENEKAI